MKIKINRIRLAGIAAMFGVVCLAGCKPAEQPGTAEKTGAAVDTAAEKTAEASVTAAEKAREAAKKAAEATKDFAEKAVDKTGAALEKAGAAMRRPDEETQE
jgi:hypothetical protein